MDTVITAIIVGAGEAGQELYQALKKNFPNRYNIVGFVDDSKKNNRVRKIKILGQISDLSRIIEKNKVELVFIAIPSAEGTSIKRVVEASKDHKVAFKILPRILELVRGEVRLEQLRDLQIDDLLGRAIVKTDQVLFEREFKDKVVLVTGAGGSIGSELCRQLIQFSLKKLICFDWWENGIFDLEMELSSISSENNFQGVIGSVQDYSKLEQVIAAHKPDIIFHAAAFKHVHLMQRYPEEAVKNNVFGTENLAKIALNNEVKKVVLISTDKAANPSNIMGTTKLIGERVMSYYNSKGKTKFLSVRFGNVIGSSGSMVPIFRKQIASGGPVTVTDRKMVRYAMTIPEAVQLVLFASAIGMGGEIFILDMGEPIKIDDFARLMIRLAGYIPEKEIPITYVGKRPGEKITEVLIGKGEKLEKTTHPRINKTVLQNLQLHTIEDTIRDLKEAILTSDKNQLFKILQIVAPHLEKWYN